MDDIASQAADPQVRAAAILDDNSVDVDALLASIAAAQHGRGRQVRGLLMTYPDGKTGCAPAMVLVDLHTREEYLVSQPMGPGSASCRADPQGFARASQVLRAALVQPPELCICNRFGGLEAEGGGFADDLLQLMACDIPVLTAVQPRHREAWLRFSGGAATLPPDAQAIEAWLDAVLAARR